MPFYYSRKSAGWSAPNGKHNLNKPVISERLPKVTGPGAFQTDWLERTELIRWDLRETGCLVSENEFSVSLSQLPG